MLARAAVQSAKAALQSHRNLDEDYCIVSSVGVEEIAVCADVEVEPDADIERVQAQIWFEIEQYLNPPIRFRTLQELRDAGAAVEDIFNGPELDNGFIKAGDLEAAALKSVLRVSDILNRLMDIDGVIAVNRCCSPLRRRGQRGQGRGRSRLGRRQSGVRPEQDQRLVAAVHQQPASAAALPESVALPVLQERPAVPAAHGRGDGHAQPAARRGRAAEESGRRQGSAHSAGHLPESGGLLSGPIQLPARLRHRAAGLPSNAPHCAPGQARQLKAYLMVFEQLLGNALAQLAHTADLFSLAPSIARTYFVRLFDDDQIKGSAASRAPRHDAGAVEAMVESEPEFLERRNRFLDHLLARFGENFGEYALLLTNAAGENVAQARLIDDKIAFLKRYPQISHDRGKAFDYTREPCRREQLPGHQEAHQPAARLSGSGVSLDRCRARGRRIFAELPAARYERAALARGHADDCGSQRGAGHASRVSRHHRADGS